MQEARLERKETNGWTYWTRRGRTENVKTQGGRAVRNRAERNARKKER